MILDNVEVSWVKLDPKNPDPGYGGKSLQYSLVASVTDGAKAAKFNQTKPGLFKPVLDKNTMEPTGVFNANLKRKIFKNEAGEITTPSIKVVDKKMNPIADVNSIGNGTLANVQVDFKPYDVAGNKGVSVRLIAVQVLELKEFSSSAKLEFTAIDTDSGDIM